MEGTAAISSQPPPPTTGTLMAISPTAKELSVLVCRFGHDEEDEESNKDEEDEEADRDRLDEPERVVWGPEEEEEDEVVMVDFLLLSPFLPLRLVSPPVSLSCFLLLLLLLRSLCRWAACSRRAACRSARCRRHSASRRRRLLSQ